MKILIIIFFLEIKENNITRGHNYTRVKKQSRLDVRKYPFSQRTINVWNKLSTDCVHTSSVNMFIIIIIMFMMDPVGPMVQRNKLLLNHKCRHFPASTITIRQPKPNRWFNVGPTATYLVGSTLLCSLDTRWTNSNCQLKPNQAPTITQHCPNYHQP